MDNVKWLRDTANLERNSDCPLAAQKLEEAADEITRLRALLRDIYDSHVIVESSLSEALWLSLCQELDEWRCWYCGRCKQQGHAPDCELARLLEEE